MADGDDLAPLYDTSPSNYTHPSHPLNAINLRGSPEQSRTNCTYAPSLTLGPSSLPLKNLSSLGVSPPQPAIKVNEETSSLVAERQHISDVGFREDSSESPVPARTITQPSSDSLILVSSINPIQCQNHSGLLLHSKCAIVEKKLKINSPFSLMCMHTLFKQFGSEKRALLDSIGLGGLLKVQKQRLQCRSLLLSLLHCMDPISGSISLKRGELTLNDRDVNLVLGLPYKGEDVILGSRSPEVINKVKQVLQLDSATDLTIEAVHEILMRDYGRKMNSEQRDAFKVAAILFVDSCFLGPRGCKRRINMDILSNVADPMTISSTNWAGYVLKVLKQSAAKVQHNIKAGNKTVLLEGCILFLLVFYLDNLNFGYMTPPHDILPRIVKYTPPLVAELLSYDRLNGASHKIQQYGRCKLRPREEVVYSRHFSGTTNQSPITNKFHIPQLSTASSFKVAGSITSLAEETVETKVDGPLSSGEALVAFDEYVQIFSNQIQRSTDELRRKVVKLVKNFPHAPHSCEMAATDLDHKNYSSEPECGVPTNLELKAPNRRHYMTVLSSSINSSKINHDKSYLHDDDYNLVRNSPSVAETSSAASLKLHPPSALSHQGNDSTDNVYQIKEKHLFVVSPFDLHLKHNEVPLKTLMKVISVLSKLSIDEKNMFWYVHHLPTKLQIAGANLYEAFFAETDFSTEIMNAVMRLYHELDDEMYKGCSVNRWRHYLPSDWVKCALLHGDPFRKTQLKEMFVGPHLTYNVANCNMVFLPFHNGSYWSLYVWDFHTSTISVMDPVINSIDIVCLKHDATMTQLHEAMIYCHQQICGCFVAHNRTWHRNYLTMKDQSSSMSKSGLYTVFYARFFDGGICTRTMAMEDSVTLFQTTLLCQLLASIGNKGIYPEAIMAAIAEATL